MTINELLDRAKHRANLATDYALAKALGVKTGHVSDWRNPESPRHPSTDEAIQLAALAGLEELQVIAMIELQTAKNEKKREFWRHFIESRGIAACLTMTALACSLAMSPKAANASVLHLGNYNEKPRQAIDSNIHYANRRRYGYAELSRPRSIYSGLLFVRAILWKIRQTLTTTATPYAIPAAR